MIVFCILFCILYQESDYNVIDDVSQILDFIQCPGLGSYYNVWVISSPGYSPWLIRCLSRFSGVSQYLHSILLQFTQWVLIGYKMAGHFWRQLTTKHTYSFREWAMIYKLIRAKHKTNFFTMVIKIHRSIHFDSGAGWGRSVNYGTVNIGPPPPPPSF